MNIQNILLEGISPIVFHYTNLKNLYNILNSNKLELSPGGLQKKCRSSER